ncbi:hypothetical protein B4U80_03524 [Leptotrombidium deliense]|uniref:Sodium-dependent multivitamin transporter-like protein n=1 Tax=Leptotrombidium deliense TaxID=299467 RepID=A0A443SDQ0_9ACAR|nr:hypothetical protein B4U80_03524 [Leptotrombidium deliense]
MALFAVVDYLICGLMLLISLSIGIYFAYVEKKKQSSFDILLGSGNQKIIPVSLSLLASFVSSVTVLGIPAEVYTYGFHFWTIVIFFPVIIAVTANLFLPIFFELNIASVYKGKQQCGSCLKLS